MSFDFRESTALFGGSFNPPHLGHTQAIHGLLKSPGVKKIMVLPSFGTPLKKVSISFEQRMEMAKLAFRGIAQVEISDFEYQNQTQYSWQLLEKLGPELKNPAFVIGTDQFEKLDQWSKFPAFLGLCDWIILLRKPTSLDSISPIIKKYAGTGMLIATDNRDEFTLQGRRVKFVETEAIEASSTQIREDFALKKGDAMKELIAADVRDYILRNKIYG